MTSLTNLARETIDAFNHRDWDQMKTLLSPNCVYDEVSSGNRLSGYAEILEAMKGWTQAFKDVHGTVTSTMERGDTVVLEIVWRGTHNGTFEGPEGSVPPSGASVTTRAVEIFECSGARVTEMRHYFDLYAMLRQIGAITTERQKARKARA